MKKIEKKEPNEIYEGNVEVTKNNEKNWEEKLKKIKVITGYVRAYQGATITAPNLTEVTGYVRAYQGATITAPNLKSTVYIAYQGATITAPNLKSTGDVNLDTILSPETEIALWKAAKKNKWQLTNNCSEWLLSQKGNFTFYINSIEFDRLLFDKVRCDELTAQEVFAITNMEQRRIAYERMDKVKMKDLPDYKIIHEVADDEHGYPMKVISFTMAGYNTPFKFLNCFCPSSGREYFLETKQDDCWKAKAMSFGFEDITFDEEW